MASCISCHLQCSRAGDYKHLSSFGIKKLLYVILSLDEKYLQNGLQEIKPPLNF